MKPDAEAAETMPTWPEGKPVPTLIRIAAHMPKTTRAEMEAWRALQREATIDRKLLQELFWVVSSKNDCFY